MKRDGAGGHQLLISIAQSGKARGADIRPPNSVSVHVGDGEMSVQEAVVEEIRRVAAEQKKALAPVDRNAALLSIGLDSLCFAILVARLEERFDFDPFSATDDFVLPVTVGDFIDLYEHAPV